MKQHIKHQQDLRWLIAHTGGFRGGYITDLQMSKKRLLDEDSGHQVFVGTSVTVVIRYSTRDMVRVARLTMNGVSDFSILEQEGSDCSSLSVIHAELTEDRLRFWFDPQGTLYVVCEEAFFEEISTPYGEREAARAFAQWTFQTEEGRAPTVEWLLTHLDEAGIPCTWRDGRAKSRRSAVIRWEGELLPSSEHGSRASSIQVVTYGPVAGPGFGMTLRAPAIPNRDCGRILSLVADLIACTYAGTCLVGESFFSRDEWLNWKSLESVRQVR
jgi:hypothetical protein